MTVYESLIQKLKENPRTWLITGVSGFIGSHLLETLLNLEQKVIGVDNFSTSTGSNLDVVRSVVSPTQWSRFLMLKADIRNTAQYESYLNPKIVILHQAALASVPRSLTEPELYFDNNVEGTRKLFQTALDHGVKKIVFASSSAVYGDDPATQKYESQIGRPLSPYAENKWQNEQDAIVLTNSTDLHITALRYFNVFGERQDPKGAYAAVIPAWVSAFAQNRAPQVFGNGLQTRDFCHVQNIVAANLLASQNTSSENPIYNVGMGGEQTLLELFSTLKSIVLERNPRAENIELDFQPAREGDIFQSQASIEKIQNDLGYDIVCDFRAGLSKTVDWFL